MNENGNEKDGRLPAAQGRAGGLRPEPHSRLVPDGLPSLTHDNLFRLAKQIEHEKSYDGDLPEIIRQCAERISELEDDINDARSALEVSKGCCLRAEEVEAENERLRKALEPFARYGDVIKHLGGSFPKTGTVHHAASAIGGEAEVTAEDYYRASALLASCDERPSGLRPERAQGASPPARPDEGGGRPTSLPLEEKQ